MAEGKELVISISYSNGAATVTTDDADVQGFPKTYHSTGKHDPRSYCKSVAELVERETGREVRFEVTSIDGVAPTQQAKGRWTNKRIVIVAVLASVVIFAAYVAFALLFNNPTGSRSSYVASSSSSILEQRDGAGLTDTQKEMLEEIKLIEPTEVHSESNSLYNVYVGTLENKSDKTHYFIKVKGEFKDDQGNTIDTDWTYACGDEGLRPGESTKFKLSVDRDERITNMSCYTYDYQ